MEGVQKNLFDTIQFGPHTLRNRFAMAPLTRCRADPLTGVPNELHVEYYTARAEDAGVVFTECSQVSTRSLSFRGSCGIHSDEQVEGWQKVTDSVHTVGGKIYLQIWHCGRAAISEWLGGEQPLAPSSIKNRMPTRGKDGMTEYSEPKEMTLEDIKEVREQFRQGARNAKRAGFDGVELHGANGYLIDEFLRDGVNKRTDDYGGSVENRCRFPLEVVDALIEEFGADRVGVKVTPVGRYNDMFDSDPVATYTHFFKELNNRRVAFIELTRAPEFVPVPNHYGINGEDQIPNVYETFRPVFNGVIIANNGFDFESGNKLVEEGLADMISFGRSYIANPDLSVRCKNNWPLTPPNFKTFYTPGAEGYNDYTKYQA